MNSNKKLLLLLILITVLAIFLRIYDLKNAPPGLYPDEAMNGNNALEAINAAPPTGGFKVFYPENNGREGLFINIQALTIGLIGLISPIGPANEPWVLRLPSAIFGILTVLGTFFLTKELFQSNAKSQAPNPKQITNPNDRNSIGVWNLEFGISRGEQIALLAAFLLATSFWHINFSRIGFRAIMAPFFLTWALYFLLKSLKSNSKFYFLDSIFSGVLYGLGFYSYIAYRATPLLILVILWFFWRRAKIGGWQKQFLLSIFYFLFSAVIVALPFIFYFLQNPQDFFGRTAQVSVFASEAPLRDLATNILKTFGMFNVSGDWNWRHNIAEAPLLFWPVGILFIIGIFLGIKSILRKSDFLKFPFLVLLAWLIVAAIPVVISNEGIPHALRSILMIPAVFIITAFGGQAIHKWFKSKNVQRHLIHAFYGLFFFVVVLEGYYSYFLNWAGRNEVAGAFAEDYIQTGQLLNSLPREMPKYVIVEASGVDVRGIPMPAQTVMFITNTFSPEKQKEKNIHYILPQERSTIPPGSFTATLK